MTQDQGRVTGEPGSQMGPNQSKMDISNVVPDHLAVSGVLKKTVSPIGPNLIFPSAFWFHQTSRRVRRPGRFGRVAFVARTRGVWASGS